jgi:hypothetical protein
VVPVVPVVDVLVDEGVVIQGLSVGRRLLVGDEVGDCAGVVVGLPVGV